MDALSPADRLKLEAARSIREDFLHQDAFHEVDTYTSLEKQYSMMKLVLAFYESTVNALQTGIGVESLVKLSVRERIGRFKYTPEDQIAREFDGIIQSMNKEIEELSQTKEDF